MKVVALVSGGKDSCFTMCEVVRRGHTLVAMANLLPADETVEDVDSFSFQTAGHTLIELLAACMPSTPLYRRRMRGSSRSVDMQYTRDNADEVEDLYVLLKHVKQRHPEVNAVCAGAILSNYQRLRVEHVCERLGLTSLAYLWEREQTGLLTDMLADGVEAVLVKVAAMGLVPAKHLGQSLRTLFPLMKKLEAEFGCSVCGEGGEYETFVLDCSLFVNRIEIVSSEKRAMSKDPIAPVGLLLVREARVVSKATGEPVEAKGIVVYCEDEESAVDRSPPKTKATVTCDRVRIASRIATKWYGSVTLALEIEGGESNEFGFAALASALSSFGRPIFVAVQSHDIATFAAFNQCYKTFFPLEPPARAVWQSSRKSDRLIVNAVLAQETASLKSRHVQSVSCWAPACIGPYSQAITYRGLCWISGQIPLVPDTMLLSAEQSLGQCLSNSLAVAKSQGCRGGGKSLVSCIALFVGAIDVSPVPRHVLCLPIRVAALPRGAQFEAVCIAETGEAEYRKETWPTENASVAVEISRPARQNELGDDDIDKIASVEKDLVFVTVRFRAVVETFSLGNQFGTCVSSSNYCVGGSGFPNFDVVEGLEDGVVAVSWYCFEQK